MSTLETSSVNRPSTPGYDLLNTPTISSYDNTKYSEDSRMDTESTSAVSSVSPSILTSSLTTAKNIISTVTPHSVAAPSSIIESSVTTTTTTVAVDNSLTEQTDALPIEQRLGALSAEQQQHLETAVPTAEQQNHLESTCADHQYLETTFAEQQHFETTPAADHQYLDTTTPAATAAATEQHLETVVSADAKENFKIISAEQDLENVSVEHHLETMMMCGAAAEQSNEGINECNNNLDGSSHEALDKHTQLLDEQPSSIEGGGISRRQQHVQALTDDERARIRERYSEKAKERRLRMYEKAILLAEEKEREEGRRHRAQRGLYFTVGYQTYYGQNVYIIGSTQSLGGWDPTKAIPLTWCPGNLWTGNITSSIDDGFIEYKYLTKDSNTGAIVWEPGFNHKIDTSKLTTTTTNVENTWGVGGTL